MKCSTFIKKTMICAVAAIALASLSGCPNIFSALGGSGSGGGGGGGGGAPSPGAQTPAGSSPVQPTNEDEAKAALAAGKSLDLTGTSAPSSVTLDTDTELKNGQTITGKGSGQTTINTGDENVKVTGNATIDNVKLEVDDSSGVSGRGLEVESGGTLTLTGTEVDVKGGGDVKVDGGGTMNVGAGSSVIIGDGPNSATVEIAGTVNVGTNTSGGRATLEVGEGTTSGTLGGVLHVGPNGDLILKSNELTGGAFGGSIVFDAGATCTTLPAPGLTLNFVGSGSSGAVFSLGSGGSLTQTATSYTISGTAALDPPVNIGNRFGLDNAHTLELLDSSKLTINAGKELDIGILTIAGTAILEVNGTLTFDSGCTLTTPLADGATITFGGSATISGAGIPAGVSFTAGKTYVYDSAQSGNNGGWIEQ